MGLNRMLDEYESFGSSFSNNQQLLLESNIRCDLPVLECVRHFAPIYDLLNDEIFIKSNEDLKLHTKEPDLYIIHLETLTKDLTELGEDLCESFGYCKKLPKLMKNIEEQYYDKICEMTNYEIKGLSNCIFDDIYEMYDDSLIKRIQKIFKNDFKIGGYSDSLQQLLPIRRS